jgi:hypothetical protein
LYRGKGSWKERETAPLQRLFVSPNYQEIHDSRYISVHRISLIKGGDFTAGNGTGFYFEV